MDKFLKLKLLKENELKSIESLIDSNNLEIYKSEIYINEVEESISKLEKEQQKNGNLITKINEFPKFKKYSKIAAMLVFIIQNLILIAPIIVFALTMGSIPAILLATIFIIVINAVSAFIIGKDLKKTIDSRKNEIKNFTIADLEQRNNEIAKEKARLNDAKVSKERRITELKDMLKQYKLERACIQESINFIENLRAEVIERLCSEILDEQFETEQGRPAFQKVIKPNHKQIN